ncbi:hypothetical protein [Actinobaculum sp. 352]|uniref:hypothetical protein n=1 Tax=Actinobaculum sp. 352 TaxID=2490946 RepID=UPI000F7E7652|nr:hypothetical protein [Actinobaculum sp. 352]RTE50379.1 hypothetical protein EKN07_04065 [Actinobaculum sp. 352]
MKRLSEIPEAVQAGRAAYESDADVLDDLVADWRASQYAEREARDRLRGAVQAAAEAGVGMSEMARRLELSRTIIYDWTGRYPKDPKAREKWRASRKNA